jgi:EAL domain-containing protein (putative c-di-GMP-specific phosphodiesterase class I)
LAEETGLITLLGHDILRQSCAQVARWNRTLARPEPLTVSVNLSMRQLRDAGLVAQIAEVLNDAALPAPWLTLELTESLMADDPDGTAATLEQIAALGVRLAIDDFGMGYSTLSLLRRYPLHYLKIDRHFVAGLGQDLNDTVVVSGVTGLAHGLGLIVLAEGVETAEHVVSLFELGCDLGQGFFFSRPLTAAALERVLAARDWSPQLVDGITTWLRGDAAAAVDTTPSAAEPGDQLPQRLRVVAEQLRRVPPAGLRAGGVA